MEKANKRVAAFVDYIVKRMQSNESFGTKQELVNYLKKEMPVLKTLYMAFHSFIVGQDEEIINGVSAQLFN